MKRILFTLCMIMAFSLQAQQTVVIPRKFEFQKEANRYQLNELTKFLFEKYGFKTLWEDEIPKDLANRRCDLLFAKVTDDSNMFTTKLKVHLDDCQGGEVYVSEEGKTREKDYKTAYHKALREAFAKDEMLAKFKDTYVNNQKGISVPSVAQKVQPKKEEKEDVEVVSEMILKEIPSKKVFAQKLKDGFYQLVDSTPKIVLKVYKASVPDVFTAENETSKGIFYKKDGKYVYEYHQDGKLVKEVFDVELE